MTHKLGICIPYRNREEHLKKLVSSLGDFLEKKGIETQVHYRQALVEMKAYNYLNLDIKKNFSEVKKISKEILCLPISPDKTKKQIKYIIKNIKDFYK